MGTIIILGKLEGGWWQLWGRFGWQVRVSPSYVLTIQMYYLFSNLNLTTEVTCLGSSRVFELRSMCFNRNENFPKNNR